jgi:hypothetical protein
LPRTARWCGSTFYGGIEAAEQLAAALILKQIAKSLAQCLLSCRGEAGVGDGNRRGQLSQLNERAGGKSAWQVLADQGCVKLTESDQPVDLNGVTLEAADLYGFPKVLGEFMLK